MTYLRQSVRQTWRRFAPAALSLALAACAVGPDYVRPTADVPAAFKEGQGWTVARPGDAAPRGDWWRGYGDATLDKLEQEAAAANQNLKQAEASYRQASALVRSARAGYYPAVSGNVAASRSGGSSRSGARTVGVNGTVVGSGAASVVDNRTLSVDVNWEADLWGRVRRGVEADEASAAASLADVESTRLSIQAQVAQSYFQLRALDAQRQLYDRTLADYRRSLQLAQNQYAAGVVARSNVVLAESQLRTAEAQAIDLGVQRAQLEHAIALLAGKPPSDFSLPATPLNTLGTIPVAPVAVPSTLLERRPDIAAAERRVAAANARIGMAKAAYFPDLSLSASGGFQGSSFANWLTLPNRFWSLGPALAATLFDAGARHAQAEQAIAAYDATVAAYRQTVLTGFQEVEDNLAALRILEQEAATQAEALRLARESVALTLNQYRAGTVSYLDVVNVQTAALNAERTAVDLLDRRLAASVLLVKALGGGWEEAAGGVPR